MNEPRVSLVTPCYNSAATIERAIRSVLNQEDASVEYIIVDGGSSDGTVDVISRYADRLAYWVSEPDRGQTHAINKGFARATGQVLGWLNADDELEPGVLTVVKEFFRQDEGDVVCGACRYLEAEGREWVRLVTQRDLAVMNVNDPIHQPSCFWRRDLHDRVGGLDESLHYGMDWDLWLRFAQAGARFGTTDQVLSRYHMTGTNKTSVGGDERNRELYELTCRYNKGASRLLAELAYRVMWPLKRARRREPQWFFRPCTDMIRTAFWVTLGPLYGFDHVRRCTHPYF